MSVFEHVRYHESAHAVAAERLTRSSASNVRALNQFAGQRAFRHGGCPRRLLLVVS